MKGINWLLLAFTLAWITSQSVIAQGYVTLDHVDGAVAMDKLLAGKEVVFYVRISNYTADTVVTLNNSFELFSPDNAIWIPWLLVDTYYTGPPPTTIFDTTFYGQWVEPSDLSFSWFPHTGMGPYLLESQFDYTVAPLFGSGADTIGFGGSVVSPMSMGVPPGFNRLSWTIKVALIAESEIGKTLCLDSAITRNGSIPLEIRWLTKDLEKIYPEWDGPHCFTITDQCCWGMRGNVNLDWKDTIDISDLTSLVGWMFKSGSAPQCMLEADVDGNTDHDIADVTHLVGYMFKSGPPPVGCP